MKRTIFQVEAFSISKVSVVGMIILFFVIGRVIPSHAFGIRPTGTKNGDTIIEFEVPSTFPLFDREFRKVATELFTNPVHERATNIVYGCVDNHKDSDMCGDPETLYAPEAVLAGNQWNDNPPFELISTGTSLCKEYVGKTIRAPYAAGCWYMLFRDAEKKSAKGEYFDAKSGNVLLYRVHFGDMQFLHSMATRDGEEARVTKEKVIMWAEFTYKIATGALSRSVVLNQTGIPGMKELFYNRGWTAQQLFIRGDGTFHADNDFRNFAFGSLLHLVQDSFTVSHTERDEPTGAVCPGSQKLYAPGKVLGFHSYVRQDKKLHSAQDTQDALSANLAEMPPSAIDAGKALKEFYDNNRPWEEVKQYLDCVFDLDDPAAQAGPGEDFQKT